MNALAELVRLPEWQVVGWAVLHAAWQVSLVGGALGLVLRGAAPWGPQVRYRLALGALVIMLGVPVATGAWARSVWREHEACWAIAERGELVPSACVGHGLQAHAGVEVASDAPVSPFQTAALRVTRGVGLVGIVWVLGAAWVLARRMVGWAGAERLRRSGTAAPPAWAVRATAEAAARLGVRRPVAVRRSARVDSPLVIGWRRPTILLPTDALATLSRQEIETVLAHELAHVRRSDYLANLLASLAEPLLWYHPAFAAAARRARTEREFCCDDLVAERSGHGVRTYLGALLKLDARRAPRQPLALGAADGDLLPRARRLAAPRRAPTRARLALATAAALAVGAGSALLLDVELPAELSAWAVMTADLETRSSPAPPHRHR